MTPSTEFLYATPTWVLALMLLALVLGMIALGARLGQRHAALSTGGEKSQVSALRGSLLGLLALLVGFSFSLALGRYNDRSVAVVEEANAIGTAWLRTDLMAAPDRAALRALLADYAASRLTAGRFTIAEADRLAEEGQKSDTAFAAAWAIAAQAAQRAPNPATVALTAALNDMTDSYASHEAALNRHVPEVVFLMLTVTLLFLSWVVGYASGEAGERTPGPMYLTMGLIILLLALVLDLDRPRRGAIRVDQTPMVLTVTHILAEAGRPLPTGT